MKPRSFKAFRVAGAEGLEPLARGFGEHGSYIDISFKGNEITLENPELDFKKIEKSGDTFVVSI